MKIKDKLVADGLYVFDTFYSTKENKQEMIDSMIDKVNQCGHTIYRVLRIKTDVQGMLKFEMWVNRNEQDVHDTEIPVRRRGRPKTKTEPDKQINIRIPCSVLQEWDEIKPIFGNNITLYINKLITNDLEKNKSEYLELLDKLDRMRGSDY